MILRALAATVLALAIGTALQADVSARVAIGAARPDFLLIAVVCISLLTNATFSIASGLCAGAIAAALSGINYGTFIVTRIAAAWVSTGIAKAMSRQSLLTPLVAIAAATLTERALAFLMAPGSIRASAAQTAGELIYNLALVVPAYLALQPLMRPRRIREPIERRLRRQSKRTRWR